MLRRGAQSVFSILLVVEVLGIGVLLGGEVDLSGMILGRGLARDVKPGRGTITSEPIDGSVGGPVGKT